MLSFIVGESIYSTYGSEIGDNFIEKLQSDNRFTEHEDCFFFLNDELEQIIIDYKEIKKVFKDYTSTIKEYIESSIFDYEEFTYINALSISNGFIIDVMGDHFWSDDVIEKFLANPEETLEEVRKAATNYCASVTIGEIMKELKDTGIEIDMEVVKDSVNA